MTKAQARRIIDLLGLPDAQAKEAYRTIVRATTKDDIAVRPGTGGEILIIRGRPGFIGRQEFEDTIFPDGSKRVVQKAYDDLGNLVHHDPKGGSP